MPLEAFYKHAHIELQRLHNTPCLWPELPPFGFGFVRRNNPILHIKQFAPCCGYSFDNRELNHMAGVNDLKGMYYETF